MSGKFADFTGTARRVLVACHPKPFDTHWLKAEIMAEEGKNARYETIDDISGGDYTGDILTVYPGNTPKTWVAGHKNTFDSVYLPDCGGEWFELMEERSKAEAMYTTDLYFMIDRLKVLLKPKGKLYLGKWLTDAKAEAARVRKLGFAASVEVKLLGDATFIVLSFDESRDKSGTR